MSVTAAAISASGSITATTSTPDSPATCRATSRPAEAAELQAPLIPGTIPDPATVPVDSWEVTVEPDEDQLEALSLPLRVFTVQLPSNQLSVTVPSEYLQQYITAGITTFKFEVGAKAGENQTFTESSFSP